MKQKPLFDSFPDDFAWGVSSSAYQTEDPAFSAHDANAFKTDWDLFYEAGHLAIPKGNGTKSFTHYERDIEALKAIGATHYRFGVEWARIEPEPGRFNENALDHYVQIAKRLREERIIPIVTLWHFTFPAWLTDFHKPERHGWLHEKALSHWIQFVRRAIAKLKPYVDWIAPQNEPNTQSLCGYLSDFWPPAAGFHPLLYYRNMEASILAFQKAALLISEIHPRALLLSIQNLVYWRKSRVDPLNFFYRYAQDFNFYHLDRIADYVDWIGFTYYMGEVASPFNLQSQKTKRNEETSDLGWPIYPQGLTKLIAQVSRRYRKPMLIVENGIADASDTKRQRYLIKHLACVREAIRQGFDLRGYFHWSLMDNYEWAYGYEAKFGLYSVDSKANRLVPKESARMYRDYIALRDAPET